MELKEIADLLDKVAQTFGPFLGVMFVLTLVGIGGILLFFKRQIENIADEISAKTMKIYETKLGLALRDEETRKELVVYLAKKSIDSKLDIYGEVYKLYFEYQTSWSFDSKTSKEEIDKLWTRMIEMRRKIFLSSIYLGGFLTENLLKAVITMQTLLEKKVTEIRNPFASRYSGYSYTEKDPFESETKLGDYLHNAEKYISKNLQTQQELSQYDFNEEQKTLLQKEKEKLFK